MIRILRLLFSRSFIAVKQRSLMQPAPPLVDQPGSNPTRKWTAARITELAVSLLGFLALFGLDIEISPEDVDLVVGGIGVLVTVGGGIAGWLTRNRAAV